jgi:hypothetical protein
MSSYPVGPVGGAVPAVPPGPGVAPPFAAPPTDKSKRSLLIGLGVGGLVLLLCCVGGLFGVGILAVGGTEDAKRQATSTVTTYLDALLADDYATAHQQLCNRLARQLSVEDLQLLDEREPFTGFRLDEPSLSATVEVTAHLAAPRGEIAKLFSLETAGQHLKICDIR